VAAPVQADAHGNAGELLTVGSRSQAETPAGRFLPGRSRGDRGRQPRCPVLAVASTLWWRSMGSYVKL